MTTQPSTSPPQEGTHDHHIYILPGPSFCSPPILALLPTQLQWGYVFWSSMRPSALEAGPVLAGPVGGWKPRLLWFSPPSFSCGNTAQEASAGGSIHQAYLFALLETHVVLLCDIFSNFTGFNPFFSSRQSLVSMQVAPACACFSDGCNAS